jgi:phage shock protein A
MARQKLAEQKCIQIRKSIEEHEGYAMKALEKNDEPLAHQVAERIAEFANELASEQETHQGFSQSVEKLRDAIALGEKNLKRLKQQVDTVKATENVQKAQSAVAERHSGTNSKMHTAMESLERIKERQALKDAQIKAASEIAATENNASLKARLEAAGITSNGASADDILARLKEKKSAS